MSTDTGPVVVAVDGTHRSAGAIRYAVEESRRRGTGLAVVHVSPACAPMTPMLPMLPVIDTMPALVEAESRTLLSGICERVSVDAPDVAVEAVLLRGSRSAAIVQAAETAPLLVLGRETRRGLERLSTGATTAKVAAHAACPVAVVPADWRAGPTRHRLVVGVRSSSQAPGLVAQAFELAAARHDALLVLHAWRLPDPYADRLEERTNLDVWLEEGERLLEEVLAEWRQEYPDVPVETRVVHLDPVAALVDASRDADLLLLARHPHGPRHLGGTARAVLSHAVGPVLVLPAHRELVLDLALEESGRLVR
jgi:nucleotide-binding universal stress UspA family protein